MFQGHRSIGSGVVFTIYGRGGHLGHVTKPSFINVFLHYSQKLYGRTHGAPYRGHGYVPLRLGGTSL